MLPLQGIDLDTNRQALAVKTNDENPADKKRKLQKNVCGKCKKRNRALARQMVCCDCCGQWFHFVCVGIRTQEEAENLDTFVCPMSCARN